MNSQALTQSAVYCMSLLPEPTRLASAPEVRDSAQVSPPDFEQIVERYYRPLYQFALSLSRSEAEACDLTQQTFLTWSTKGKQLRDASKVRAWLFTTLHRTFLQRRRRDMRFPHYDLSEVDAEMPEVQPVIENRLDGIQAVEALEMLDEVFRAPLALFYLEDCPYKEIAAILGIPLGTVKSRIARGIFHLQKLLMPVRPALHPVAA